MKAKNLSRQKTNERKVFFSDFDSTSSFRSSSETLEDRSIETVLRLWFNINLQKKDKNVIFVCFLLFAFFTSISIPVFISSQFISVIN